MKAVIYARYSSDNQREESITAQVRACTEYATKRGYIVEKVYSDEAKSATTDDRPNFLQMVNDLKAGMVKAQVLIVHKLDRFARNRYDSAFYKRELSRVGVRVESALEFLDDSPESIILESVLEGMAEYYSRNLAREVMKGMKENAFQAKFNGGWVLLGYDVVDGKYFINEQEARIVRLIFSMFLEGHGYGKILAKLNELGYVTKRGKPFGKNSLYELLRNPKYAGYYVFNRAPRRVNGKRNWHLRKSSEDIITIPGAVPAIISEEDFRKVQEIMDKRKKVGPRQRSDVLYMLTGKIVCGLCGASMVGNSRRKKAGDEPRRFYECNRMLRTKECDNRRVKKEFLERYVQEQIENYFFSNNNLSDFAESLLAFAKKKEQENVIMGKELVRELNEVEGKINNIVKAIEDGGASFSILAGRLKELEVRQEELKSRLATMRSPLDGISKEMVLGYLSTLQGVMFDRLNDREKKKIMDAYVHEIKVYPESIKVTLKLDLGVDKGGVGGGT